MRLWRAGVWPEPPLIAVGLCAVGRRLFVAAVEIPRQRAVA
jgi:hypothetical protein